MTESNEDLMKFGVRPEDEGVHPTPADDPSWNESVFYDWVHDESRAGHVRIGRMPNQQRVWLWVFLLHDGEWLTLEEVRLPMAELVGEFSYEGRGLSFSREVLEPLKSNRLKVAGTGRIVSGARAGRLMPFEIDVTVDALGPAHSIGERGIAGHSSELFSASRFEQPMRVRGEQRVGDAVRTIDAFGERDHSWGPRNWNMEWYFLVAQSASRRLQCVRVDLDEESFLTMGYLGEETTVNVGDVDFELVYDDDSLRKPYEGTVRLVTEEGRELRAKVEAIDACEIDASHAFDPPQPSIYRRALVRVLVEGESKPMHGWLEINRFPGGMRRNG